MMEENKYCFVIQPISCKKYDKRFEDVYKPAIEQAGLTAYRVDKDSNVRIIIEDIEGKIKNSVLCFADISIDNPNVWYELGYAFASGKDVVMVCDESRKDFPFDISHKSIIQYKTESPSDFDSLSNGITSKIKSYLISNKRSEDIISSPLKDVEGFKPYETSLLALIVGEHLSDEHGVSVYTIKERMYKAGFNEMATSVGLILLRRKELLDIQCERDWNGNEYNVCKLTPSGVDFILNNLDLFDLSQKVVEQRINEESDDLPF